MLFAEFAKDFGVQKYFKTPKNIKYSLLANFIQLVLEADWIGDLTIEKDFSLNPDINKHFTILDTETDHLRAGDVYIILSDKRYRYGIVYDSNTVIEQPNHLSPQHIMLKDDMEQHTAYIKAQGREVVWMRPILPKNIFPSDIFYGINVYDYGAKGDGITDDSAAFQTAVAAAKADIRSGGIVYVPGGTFLILETIDLTEEDYLTAKSVVIRGASKSATTLITPLDITVFLHTENVTFQDFTVKQTGTPKTGRAFSTPTNRQSAHCVYERIHIIDFKYGMWWRFSIWNTVRDCRLQRCAVGIKMSRNALPDDQTNPAAPAGWNLGSGFFHNQNTFDNLKIEYGEVGIWGTVNGNVFTNITCQRQQGDGSDNVAAPVGVPGVGLWLQNRGNSSGTAFTNTFGAASNVVTSLYTEFTKQPLIIESAKLTITGLFAQGGPSTGAAYPQIIKMIGGILNVRAITTGGTDWFSHIINATDAIIYGNAMAASAVGGSTTPEAHSLTNTLLYQTGIDAGSYIDIDVTGDNTVNLLTMDRQNIYTVEVLGVYDGLDIRSARFQVVYWNNTLPARIIADADNSASITCQVTDGVIQLNTIGSLRHQMKAVVVAQRKLAQFPYSG